MKRKIENGITDLSYDSIKDVAYDFELDDAARERIYRNVLKRTGVKPKAAAVKPEQKVQKKPLRINFKKPAVAAAAVVLALTVGVGSIVGAGALNKTFGQLFHSLPETNYKNMLFDINQSKTDNGVTVTLTQGMCDGYALYIIQKTEFDPSVVTLTDEMLKSENGVGNAPYWSTEEVINVKETSQMKDSAMGFSSSLERAYSKLLEHDENSMTWLQVYGGDTLLSMSNDFFKDGTQFTVRSSGINNLPNMGAESYKCSFEFTFDIKLCEPVAYTLPEKVYTYNKDYKKDEFDNIPDMYMNPWYMQFSAACITGKVLDTSLRSSGKPMIEITLNDGTVYNENNGIDVGGNPFADQDLFGKEYDIYQEIYCTFDTEVDVTNIKSIKLYGYELKKTVFVMKENSKNAEETETKLELPATSPVKFSDKETKFEYEDYGSFKYKINSVNIYDNLYATGAKSKDINPLLKSDNVQVIYKYDENGKVTDESRWFGFSYMCNEKTGSLIDNCYLFEFEIELTNIDADFSDNYNNISCFHDFFDLVKYDEVSSSGHFNSVAAAYLKENNSGATGKWGTFVLNKGKTKTFHVGFMVMDNNAGAFEQMGVCLGDNDTIQYINVTKIIEDFEKKSK